MPGFIGDDMPLDRHSQKGKIPEAVQQLVPDKFIRIPQPPCIQNFIIIYHNGIIKASALAKAEFFQQLEIFHKPKGPGPADLLLKVIFCPVIDNCLQADKRMVEIT